MTTDTLTPVAERMPGRNGGTLLRGRSGVPRKSSREFFQILREHTPELADKLLELARKGNVPALQLALSYAVGKPPDKVELSGPDGGPIETRSLSFDDHETKALRDAIDRLTGNDPALLAAGQAPGVAVDAGADPLG